MIKIAILLIFSDDCLDVNQLFKGDDALQKAKDIFRNFIETQEGDCDAELIDEFCNEFEKNEYKIESGWNRCTRILTYEV